LGPAVKYRDEFPFAAEILTGAISLSPWPYVFGADILFLAGFSLNNASLISFVFPKQSSLPLLNFQAFFNSHPRRPAVQAGPRTLLSKIIQNETKGVTNQKTSAKSTNGLIKIP
jgi:hypothetical protein